MNKYFASTIFGLSLLMFDCKKDGKDIITPPNPPSHPTIVWTADTIRNPYPSSQLKLRRMWGSDTNDVYIVGHNAMGGRSSLYHYDGIQWTAIKVTTAEGGFIRSYVEISEVSGTGKNDVWAAGSRGGYYGTNIDSTLVLHYDGTAWSEVNMPRCKGGFEGVRALGPTDVYFSGTSGEIVHYNGVTYTKTLLDSNTILSLHGNANYLAASGISYLEGHVMDNYVSIFEKGPSGTWQLVNRESEMDYFSKNLFGIEDLYSLNDGRVFSAGHGGIFVRVGSAWTSSVNDGHGYSYFRGTSDDNIFALSMHQSLLHWNGVEWKSVNTPPGSGDNTYWAALCVIKDKIFITNWYQFDANIIFRGTYSK